MEIDEVKTAPYASLSRPFVVRLLEAIRRAFLDHMLSWNALDLERKLTDFQSYFNAYRVHSSLGGQTAAQISVDSLTSRAELHNFRWQAHCCGLYDLPVAA